MDSPISALPQVGNPTANDFIPIVQNGVTSKMTVGQFQQNLPISAAEQAALDAKAPKANPSFTGNVGIGTTAPGSALQVGDGTGRQLVYISAAGYDLALGCSGGTLFGLSTGAASEVFNTSNVPLAVGTNASQPLILGTVGIERARLTPSGFFGLGTPGPSQYSHGGSAKLLEIFNSDTATNSQAHTILSTGATVASSAIGALSFAMPNVTAAGKLMSYISSESHSSHTSAVPASSLIFVTRNNGNLVEAMRLDAGSNLLVGVTSNSYHKISKQVSEGSLVVGFTGLSGAIGGMYVCAAALSGANAALTAVVVDKNSSTSRSINAAGTINASGADYAEYMTKVDACGVIAKGSLVGVDASGKLVDKWADAITFMVKSTDPSYVGGDVWGNEATLGMARPAEPVFEAPAYTGCQPPLEEAPAEDATEEEKAAYAAAMTQYEADQQVYHDAVTAAQQQFDTVTFPAYESSLASFEALLEAARQKVDRIAFCGQVPVNVLGATPGQYIIPVQDGAGIKGIAVSNPSFEQYMIAVGKVIAIEADGRARIIVKPV